MEARHTARANTYAVPTLQKDVISALRNLRLPIRLFGENPADIRNRLALALTQLHPKNSDHVHEKSLEDSGSWNKAKENVVTSEVLYTHASTELIMARKRMCEYSMERARVRLKEEKWMRKGYVQFQQVRKKEVAEVEAEAEVEKKENRDGDDGFGKDENVTDVKWREDRCRELYKSVRGLSLEGSQYGDARPLSCVCTAADGYGSAAVVATGGWSGSIKLWDGKDHLNLLHTKSMAHDDRIMGIAMSNAEGRKDLMVSASIDLTAKLWRVLENRDDGEKPTYKIQELWHLKGHAARLCKIAWHPSGRYFGTTSFDHTWRLWDVETGHQLLLQDGHWKETYGICMHGDGSLCATTDFGGVVQVWDLRSGKSATHFVGHHAKRVLCCEFSPNGFQLATAGDDGIIKLFDLRRGSKGKSISSVPAHSNLITQIKFGTSSNDLGSDYLISSSFDGTCKVWSTRNWHSLTTLRGHEGKVMGIAEMTKHREPLGENMMTDVEKEELNFSLVSCGHDKTLKLWQ